MKPNYQALNAFNWLHRATGIIEKHGKQSGGTRRAV